VGIAIVGGMLTSTVLTLIVVPVVYSLMDDLAGWLRRLIHRGPSSATVPEPVTVSTPAAATTVSAEHRHVQHGPAQ